MVWLSKVLHLAVWGVQKEEVTHLVFHTEGLLASRYGLHYLKTIGIRKTQVNPSRWGLNQPDSIPPKT